jgi:arylsulfatase
VSLAYTFKAAQAKDRHTTQYFEIAGSRAIYHEGWLARTIHRVPWKSKPRATFDQDVWDLYDTRRDFSLANNVAAKNPDTLKELQALFMKETVKYNVLPLDDRSIERMDPGLAGRPDLMGARTSLTLYPGMTGIMENTFLNVKVAPKRSPPMWRYHSAAQME